MLQQDLDSLSVWESQWDKEFDPSKCQVVQVTISRKASNSSYILHGHVLEFVFCARHLGVDISNGLSWNSGIDRITSKANSTLGFMKRNIKAQNVKVREAAYNTLLRPQLKYAALIQNKKYSSLKKSNAKLSDGPPVITITRQV